MLTTQLLEELCELKIVIRALLDPGRLHTPGEVRQAEAEVQALVYRWWRHHLTELARDEAIARLFFDLLRLATFLGQVASEKSSNSGMNTIDQVGGAGYSEEVE